MEAEKRLQRYIFIDIYIHLYIYLYNRLAPETHSLQDIIEGAQCEQ